MPSNHRKSKTSSQLGTFVPDALQFLLSNKLMIEEAPLQLYVSVLIFSPNSSEVKKKNRKAIPSWILNEPCVPDNRSKSPHGVSIAHSSGIHSVAISLDSSLLATACGDCMIHIWDAITGAERLQLEGNSDGVASVCFSPNGCLVASFAQNCVTVWNIEAALGTKCQPECQFRFTRQGSGKVPSPHPICALSPNGNLVAVVDHPDHIWVWDMRVKQSVKYHFQTQSRRRPITGVYFSSDGSLLTCITVLPENPSGSETLHSWDTSTGIKVSTEKSVVKGPLLGIMPGTRYITISPRVSNSGARLVLRDARTGLDDMGIPLGPDQPIKAVCRPADGRFLLASLVGHGIIVWVLGEHKKETFLVKDSHNVTTIEFSPNGKYLISATSTNGVRIWNIEGFESKPSRLVEIYQGLLERGTNWARLMSMTLNVKTKPIEDQFGMWVRCHDGSLLATGALGGSTITIWDTKTGEEKFRLTAPDFLHDPEFSKSRNIFAAVAAVGESGVHFWETKTGQKGDILKIDGQQTYGLGNLRISEKGKRVIWTRSPFLDLQVFSQFYGWELDGLRKISSFEIPVRSPKGMGIVLSPNELYRLWSPESAVLEIGEFSSNKLRHTALRGVAKLVKFMPDGKHIWILGELEEGQRQAIQIWNIEQEGLREVYIDLPPFFPFELREVNDDVDKRWGPNEKEMKYGPQYHDGFVSPDGKLLALLSPLNYKRRYQIDLFKIRDLKALFRLQLDFETRDFQFSPSGTHLITERGNVLLPGASPPFPLLFATRSWIQEDDEDLLAIPPAYQDLLRGINGHTITFGDRVNGPLFVRLDEGMKTMTA